MKRHGKSFARLIPIRAVGHDLNLVVRPRLKAMCRIGAKIDLVMSFRDSERLGQFPGAGTKPAHIFDAAPLAASERVRAAARARE